MDGIVASASFNQIEICLCPFRSRYLCIKSMQTSYKPQQRIGTGIATSAGGSRLIHTASAAFFQAVQAPASLYQIPDGRYTSTIYALLKDRKYRYSKTS